MPVSQASVPLASACIVRATLALLLALAGTVLAAWPAAAHTALDTTDPADGSTVAEPVERVVLTFTLPITPLGDAIEITGPDGAVALEVTQEGEGEILVATPSAPLEDGDYAVAWNVAAQDGHPLDGTFGFSVSLPSPSPSPSETDASPPASVTPTPTASSMGSASPSPSASMEGMDGMDAEVGESDLAARVVARTGAAIALGPLLVGAGALVFAAVAMRGQSASAVRAVLVGVRWCGALLLGGLALRLVGRAALIAGGSFAEAFSVDGLSDALAGSVMWVFALQAVGGLAMLVGAWGTVGASWLAWLGVLAASAGHVLGGHSNTAEPRWLVLTADIAHLAAAAIWVGGVVSLLAALRRRDDAALATPGAVIARFGVVAAGAFVIVGVAGIALTWAIVDTPSDLWTTAWGVTLLVKVALVGVVAVIGGHVHFRILPRLEAAQTSEGAAAGAGEAGDASASASSDASESEVAHVRVATAWETALFVAVVAATAVLVAASIHV